MKVIYEMKYKKPGRKIASLVSLNGIPAEHAFGEAEMTLEYGNRREGMKYNVGDRVRIKSQEWWDANKVQDKILGFEYVSCGTESFLDDMACYTGAIALIEGITPQKEYTINLDDGEFAWTDEMFEEGTW